MFLLVLSDFELFSLTFLLSVVTLESEVEVLTFVLAEVLTLVLFEVLALVTF